MNIILFTQEELSQPLARKDRRAQHILKVLRLTTGDRFHMGVIDGPRGTARVTDITQQSISFDYQLSDEIPQLHPVRMIIGLTRPRFARRILKDLTALGASELHFVATDTGEKSYRLSSLWQNDNHRPHLLEGAEQAFCTRLPQVAVYSSLQECLATLGESPDAIALDNDQPTCKLSSYPITHPNPVIAIGSERGWSDNERDQFVNYSYVLASMGDRVLKTETACMTALAIVLSKLGF